MGHWQRILLKAAGFGAGCGVSYRNDCRLAIFQIIAGKPKALEP
jgi:hypothetical protein